MADPMKAAVYAGNRTIDVQDRPVPVPPAGEVVIAVDYCGICGTDLHSVMEGWGRAGVILRHEYSGRIASSFEDALRLLASGALPRSEEHTSELQSLAYLVCRLLLEKKKSNIRPRCFPAIPPT